MRLRSESLLQWAGEIKEREIEIGDDSFDQTFFIEGPKRLVLPLLDAETRRLLLLANGDGQPELSRDGLRMDVRDEKVPSALPLLLSLGAKLFQPVEIPRRLAQNAQEDPQAGVRLQNLLFLIRQYPQAPQTAEALRAACSDSSPEIRLRAAKALGANARGVLLELTETLEDDAVSAEALSILEGSLPYERMRALLDRAREARFLQTARACVERIGLSGAENAIGPLATVMEQEQGELAAAAAQALGLTGNPAAEPRLIPALQRNEKNLLVAAATALGSVGSAAAVLPLKEAAQRFSENPDLHRITNQAIAEIHSRLPGATPGQLSLAETDAGGLSLASDPSGQLSVTDEG